MMATEGRWPIGRRVRGQLANWCRLALMTHDERDCAIACHPPPLDGQLTVTSAANWPQAILACHRE
jgi:hypothetical protein